MEISKNQILAAQEKYCVMGQFSIVEQGAEIGEGTMIWNFSHIRKGAKIGKNCKIGDYVYIDQGVVIGDNVNIQNRVDIYNGVTIEDNVFIGPAVTFTNVLKPDPKHKVPVSAYRETHIREGSSLGARSVIVCGADIQGNIAAGCTVLGNQLIRDNSGQWLHGQPIKQFPKKC